MQITFDTSNPQDLVILNQFLGLALAVKAQPEVAQNTGSTATGIDLSPEGSGVSGAVAEAAAPAPEKKARKKKEPEVGVGSAHDRELQEKADAAQEEYEADKAKAADKPTIDTVRAALQSFTAAKGVPAGIELLQKFGAGRISELAEEHYTAFIEGCAA